jgi:hypothetical protein
MTTKGKLKDLKKYGRIFSKMSVENKEIDLPNCLIDPNMDCPNNCWLSEDAWDATITGAIASGLTPTEYKADLRRMSLLSKAESRTINKQLAKLGGFFEQCKNHKNIGLTIGFDQ